MANGLMYGGEQDSYPAEKLINPTLKQRLETAVQIAEQNLADAKRAREILDKFPELEELINLMNKGRF